ncbi:MAG TPA: methyltransferase domain-containing protein [Streptosporangiaceae bacterium]|nr:methyltransferase domain-containing protein [Streptosporangiaceae bacterium]
MPADRYLLGNSSAEVEHLVQQAQVYAPEAAELLDLVSVAPGSSVADIGCGALGILALLRHRVGRSGRVVGVDRDERILRAARQVDAELDIGTEFVLTDATSLDLPSDVFDLVHERSAARLLRDAGLVNVGVRATARVTTVGEYYQTFLLTMTGLVKDQITAGGRLAAAELDGLSASLRDHLRQPGALTCQPNMWQAWGTKP